MQYFRHLVSGLVVTLLVACADQPAGTKLPDTVAVIPDTIDTVAVQETPAISEKPTYAAVEKELLLLGLLDVRSLDSGIMVQLKYSTSDNFMGFDVYGEIDHAFLQPDVAARVVKAQAALKQKHPEYALLIYDAVRPLRIQRLMWDSVKLPKGEKHKYLSNPLNGSLHNYGAAVDVTIADSAGIPLDMGTAFDFFGEEAQPVKEKEMLETGKLTRQQVLNRQLLRSVMHEAGLWGIQTEWWHFNACRRADAKEKYKIAE